MTIDTIPTTDGLEACCAGALISTGSHTDECTPERREIARASAEGAAAGAIFRFREALEDPRLDLRAELRPFAAIHDALERVRVDPIPAEAFRFPIRVDLGRALFTVQAPPPWLPPAQSLLTVQDVADACAARPRDARPRKRGWRYASNGARRRLTLWALKAMRGEPTGPRRSWRSSVREHENPALDRFGELRRRWELERDGWFG